MLKMKKLSLGCPSFTNLTKALELFRTLLINCGINSKRSNLFFMPLFEIKNEIILDYPYCHIELYLGWDLQINSSREVKSQV